MGGKRCHLIKNLGIILIRQDPNKKNKFLIRKQSMQTLRKCPCALGVMSPIQQKQRGSIHDLHAGRPYHIFQAVSDRLIGNIPSTLSKNRDRLKDHRCISKLVVPQ